jgi:Disulphide bond corrector protein DsbC
MMVIKNCNYESLGLLKGRRICLCLIFNVIGLVSFGQGTGPVHFQQTVSREDNGKIKVHIIAHIDPGWHIYAMHQPKQAISVPTKIYFKRNPLIKVIGPVMEVGEKRKQMVNELNVVQDYFTDEVEYSQELKVNPIVSTNLTVLLTYQACTNEKCLPPATIQLDIPISKFVKD